MTFLRRAHSGVKSSVWQVTEPTAPDFQLSPLQDPIEHFTAAGRLACIKERIARRAGNWAIVAYFDAAMVAEVFCRMELRSVRRSTSALFSVTL